MSFLPHSELGYMAWLFALTILGILSLVYWETRPNRRDATSIPPLSPLRNNTSSLVGKTQIIPEPNDYQENLEHKNNFRQFIKRDVNKVYQEAEAVMNAVKSKLRPRGEVYFNFSRSLEYVMRALGQEKESLNKILQSEHISNRDFTLLQKHFCDFFSKYQKIVHWSRDAGKDANYNFAGPGNQGEWREADEKMRHSLNQFIGHPVFGALSADNGGIKNLNRVGWWW
jgi:hypothetical protein